jgi:protein-tyrosine phosphatase
MRGNVYWIPEDGSAPRLGIMPRPRGDDWLQDEIASLCDQHVDIVVSALTPEEEAELQLTQESDLCAAAGLRFLRLPIEDRQTPVDASAAAEFINLLTQLYREGKHIVIHCRAGIGRASLIAAGILASNGSSVADSFDKISRARGCLAPDTPEQRLWLERLFPPQKADQQ